MTVAYTTAFNARWAFVNTCSMLLSIWSLSAH